MKEDNLLKELVNHVVKSTQHVIMIDSKTKIPTSGGSGCLLIYQDRLFFVSVQHVTDKKGKQAVIDTGTGNDDGTNVYSLPALNFIDQYRIEGIDLEEPVLHKLQSLDVCYTEIQDSIEIKQKLKDFGEIIITEDLKRMIYTNLDYEPTKEEGYSFHGRIRGELHQNTLHQVDKLVLGIKYDTKVGPYERFILDESIVDELDFQGTSGAPIFSETGEPVALVAHGFLGEKYLYGFSIRELRKYLDIYIDQNPIKTSSSKRIESDSSNERFTNFDGELKIEDSMSLLRGFDNEFEINADYIIYPVLYGTNRGCNIENSKIKYENRRDANLYLGVCDVSIPRSHKMGDIERPGWFMNLFFNESPKKHFTVVENQVVDKEQFNLILNEKIGESDQNDILLFIHGFNVDFEAAMFRAAQLGYDLNFKGAVTAFSWPSAASITGYVADTDSSKLSSNYLSDFIKLLLQTTGLRKLHIIAHSMGNVALTNSLMQLKNEGLFPNDLINQIILAAPDIDKEIFIDQIMPEINRNFGLTLYASDKDQALIISKNLRKGYSRLGEGGESIVIVDGLDSIDASEVDTSLLGHGYFANTQSLINDIHMILLGLPPTSRILDSKNKIVGGKTKSYWIFRNS